MSKIQLKQGHYYIAGQDGFIVKIEVLELTKTSVQLKNHDSKIVFRSSLADFHRRYRLMEDLGLKVTNQLGDISWRY